MFVRTYIISMRVYLITFWVAETYDAYEILFNQYLKETKCLITNKDDKSDVIEDFNCILYAPPIGAVYQEDDPFPVFLEDNDFVESFKKFEYPQTTGQWKLNFISTD